MTTDLYPGAVPLAARDLLVGRDTDLRRLSRLVVDRRVVELTALSGTGKSSLLTAGLVPALEKQGFTVGVISDWSSITGLGGQRREPLDVYVAAVQQALGVELDPDDPAAALQDLALQHDGGLVVVLDQLEELLRLDPQTGTALLDVVASVAQPDGIEGIRHVLSLRSEFKEWLSRVERALPNHYWAWFKIAPVLDDHVPDVVTKPVRLCQGEVADDVVKALVRAWRQAREADPSVGLLHLQALLWVLAAEVDLKPGERLDAERAHTSKTYRETMAAADDAQVDLGDLGLRRYLDLRLKHASERTQDPALGEEALYATAHYVDELSSAGYKLARNADDLLRAAFPEFDSLAFSPEEVTSARTGTGQPPGDERREGTELLSGRLAGLRRDEALPQLLEVFDTSLGWLRDGSVVRITPDPGGRRIVTLVHDGFGRALERWSETTLRDPAAALRSPVGFSGRSLLSGAYVDGAAHGTVRRAKWPGCSIRRATFADVDFDECVLKGAVFRRCTFSRVTFRDCDMAGTLFEDCVFIDSAVEGLTTRTLSFVRPEFRQSGLSLRRLEGYGVFLDAVLGGAWSLEDSPDLTHVLVSAAEDLPPGDHEPVRGRVVRSRVAHLRVTGHDGQVSVEDSKLVHDDTRGS